MAKEATITFENEGKTKRAVITMTKKRNTYDVDLEFLPEITTTTDDLYAVMAMKFIQHLSNK